MFDLIYMYIINPYFVLAKPFGTKWTLGPKLESHYFWVGWMLGVLSCKGKPLSLLSCQAINFCTLWSTPVMSDKVCDTFQHLCGFHKLYSCSFWQDHYIIRLIHTVCIHTYMYFLDILSWVTRKSTQFEGGTYIYWNAQNFIPLNYASNFLPQKFLLL